MPYTKGFDPAFLEEHFDNHKEDFGVATAEEYEIRADLFLGGPRASTALECVRSNGDMIRYVIFTDEFGVMSKAGVILSYYIPDPRWHGCPTKLDYFEQQCKRKR
jgi:pyocin large subunit-like protein